MTKGFSLLELLAVLTILVIITVVAVPSFRTTNEEQRLNAASQEILNAVRFARSESVRKDRYHAVTIEMNTAVSVHELVKPTDSLDATNLAIHPHSKSPYSSRLSERRSTRDIEFQTAAGIFKTGPGSFTSTVYFTPQGRPFVYSPAKKITALEPIDLILNIGTFSRKIQMSAISGLVSATEV